MSSEQIWYVYQNGQQLGPFAGLQIKQMVDSKMIPQDAFLFKVGWKDWRPIEECLEEVGVLIGDGQVSDRVEQRRGE